MTEVRRLQGGAASIGVAVAPALVLDRDEAPPVYGRIPDVAVSRELERFRNAVAASRVEIEAAKQELTQQHGSTYAPILDVYLLMHGDALLIDAVAEAIENDRINAEWAVARVAKRLREPLLRDSSSYFRERALDIVHLEKHLHRHLAGAPSVARTPDRPVVLVARDLTPADAVRWLAPPTVGLVTEVGAGSSHTAVLARTYGVPAVVDVGEGVWGIRDGESVVVDGFSGEVSVGVSEDERAEAEARRHRFVTFLRHGRSMPAVTKCGVPIRVSTNLELPTEIETAVESGAAGVGLYRTELMYLDRREPPSEDDQVEVYRRVVKAMAPHPVVFRTFDWRGDKRLRDGHTEEQERAWLVTQIKAVLRASAEGSASLMFPMIGTVAEWLQLEALVAECRYALDDDSARSAVLPIGMMVEVPSAALIADRFAAHADFFAVGTNDLSHFTLARERGSSGPPVSALEPAVLRLVSNTVRAAARQGIPCSLCGEIAANPLGLGLLLGLGFRSVSVPASVVPLAKSVVRSLSLDAAEAVATEALEADSAEAVRALLVERLGAMADPAWNAARSLAP